MAFIDFEKAFGKVNRRAIWKSLESNVCRIKLLKVMYDNIYRIKHRGQLSDPINISAGVKQGCILSPILFLTILDDITT